MAKNFIDIGQELREISKTLIEITPTNFIYKTKNIYIHLVIFDVDILVRKTVVICTNY